MASERQKTNTKPSGTIREKVIELSLANPGEGLSFGQAEITQYEDSLYLNWSTRGQVVELAPVPREGTRGGWCTAESDFMTVPDIFDVNGGDRSSIIGMKTGGNNPIIIKDGSLYFLNLKSGRKVVFDMDEYFTDKHPVIGEDWVLLRRDGGASLILNGIQEIQLEATQAIELIPSGFKIMSGQQSFRRSTGGSSTNYWARRLTA